MGRVSNHLQSVFQFRFTGTCYYGSTRPPQLSTTTITIDPHHVTSLGDAFSTHVLRLSLDPSLAGLLLRVYECLDSGIEHKDVFRCIGHSVVYPTVYCDYECYRSSNFF